jgi:hypothetical protein
MDDAAVFLEGFHDPKLTPGRHYLEGLHEVVLAVTWLRAYGQRVIVAPHAMGGVAAAGVLFQPGPDAPVRMAIWGDTLVAHWDGSITVERLAPNAAS